jgi:hypothetical protein
VYCSAELAGRVTDPAHGRPKPCRRSRVEQGDLVEATKHGVVGRKTEGDVRAEEATVLRDREQRALAAGKQHVKPSSTHERLEAGDEALGTFAGIGDSQSAATGP